MLKKNLKLAYKINRLVVFDFPPFSGGTKGGGEMAVNLCPWILWSWLLWLSRPYESELLACSMKR